MSNLVLLTGPSLQILKISFGSLHKKNEEIFNAKLHFCVVVIVQITYKRKLL